MIIKTGSILAACAMALSGCVSVPAVPPPTPIQIVGECKPAPLDPAPTLPEVTPAKAPGYAYCFSKDEAAKLEKRIVLLKRDSDYCREAYEGIK